MAVFARERGVKERVDDFARQCRADDACADAQHVHVVVLNRLMRGVGVVADGGTDAGEFVGGDGDAGATAADDDSAFGMAVEHRLRHGFGRVRVVTGADRMCPEIDRTSWPCRVRHAASSFVSVQVSGMIGAQSDSHESVTGYRDRPRFMSLGQVLKVAADIQPA